MRLLVTPTCPLLFSFCQIPEMNDMDDTIKQRQVPKINKSLEQVRRHQKNTIQNKIANWKELASLTKGNQTFLPNLLEKYCNMKDITWH
jgi:hypothetical protein